MPEPGPGCHWPSRFLADQLTLFQQEGADSANPLLWAPPIFFTFRHHCSTYKEIYIRIFPYYVKKDSFQY